ncbi:MAG TPA: ribulokinase [Kineosporiaceae bacterium]
MTERPDVVVGVDYGTLSGRAVVVRVSDGEVLGSAVHPYRHAVIDNTLPDGTPLPPDTALQAPADWREVLSVAVPAALGAAGIAPAAVIGIGTDFTASTVLPVLREGTPLCELPGLAGRLHAWPKLWKHHAAQPQAERINALAAERGETWLARYGGRISSEWQFAKALQVLQEDEELYRRAERWIEAADWIVWQLCGAETRNTCTAGYKGIYQNGSYPGTDFCAALDPRFADFVTEKLEHPLSPLGGLAGRLTAQGATLTGLPEGIAVAVGNVDAHVTAAAADAVAPGRLLAVMGTSTCLIMSSPVLAEVPGMCGVVRDGVVPGLLGYEAGQSAVGDIFAWYVENQVPPPVHDEASRRGVDVHTVLSERAAVQEVGEHGLIALDWHGGNRSVLVDHDLSGVVVGQTLATAPEDVYRALIEATAFGARTIMESFTSAGVPVNEVVISGGLVKNAFLMQTYADVLAVPLSITGSEQGPAVGSAIHAAVAAGRYPDIHAAAAAMGRRQPAVHRPDPARAKAYDTLFAEYTALHDHFGRGGTDVLHRLRAVRNAARARRAARPLAEEARS